MGTINTAIKLSNIRSKIDAQQQIISMLELELQKAILGDEGTKIIDLFTGSESRGVQLPVTKVMGLTVGNSNHHQGERQLYNHKETGNLFFKGFLGSGADAKEYFIPVEKLDIPVNDQGQAPQQPSSWANGDGQYDRPADWPQTPDGNYEPWAAFHPVTGEPTFPVENYDTYYQVSMSAAEDLEAASTPVEGNESLYSDIDISTQNSYSGIEEVYGARNHDLADAVFSGLGDFGADLGEVADQTVIRQMLYQARALLGELRVEEQHWNQEVNEEKTRRKDLGEFAKG